MEKDERISKKVELVSRFIDKMPDIETELGEVRSAAYTLKHRYRGRDIAKSAKYDRIHIKLTRLLQLLESIKSGCQSEGSLRGDQ